MQTLFYFIITINFGEPKCWLSIICHGPLFILRKPHIYLHAALVHKSKYMQQQRRTRRRPFHTDTHVSFDMSYFLHSRLSIEYVAVWLITHIYLFKQELCLTLSGIQSFSTRMFIKAAKNNRSKTSVSPFNEDIARTSLSLVSHHFDMIFPPKFNKTGNIDSANIVYTLHSRQPSSLRDRR